MEYMAAAFSGKPTLTRMTFSATDYRAWLQTLSLCLPWEQSATYKYDRVNVINFVLPQEPSREDVP